MARRRATSPRARADVPRLGRRAAVAAFALSLSTPANAVELVQPATADDRAPTLVWAGGTPFSATAKQIVDGYYGPEFVTYLSRFLLNFDGDCSNWWAQQERAVPASYDKKRRTAFLAAKFGTFTSSVEYGLRRYPGSSGRKALLDKLTQQHGFDPERRRHLALAFTLLAPDRQPVRGIKDLLVGVPVYGKRGRRRRGFITTGLFAGAGRLPICGSTRVTTSHSITSPGFNKEAFEIRGLAPVLASQSSVFGDKGKKAVTIERPLELGTYASFAVAGLLGCSATHAVLVPIDVVKTRQQTEAEPDSIGSAAIRIYENEGLSALFLGAAPTLAGYCYGLTVYPGYEYFSRTLSTLVAPSQAIEFRAAIVLLAGALATLVACVGCVSGGSPANPSRSGPATLRGRQPVRHGGTGVKGEEGNVLYNGFRPLVVRQVIFGMVKFFFFDSLADAIFQSFPSLEAAAGSRLFVSFLAGLAAGTASSLVSQPADAVLSRVNARGGQYPVVQAFIYPRGGVVRGVLQRGAGAVRVEWPGDLGAVRDLRRAQVAVRRRGAGPDAAPGLGALILGAEPAPPRAIVCSRRALQPPA